MAEVQRPIGVVDRVKGKLREMFTPTGRAEVMAQKYAERVLAQVPEADRAKAMELLEQRRPELVEAYKGQAKGSLVRDAVIGAVVVGGVGAGIWKREWIGGKLKIGAEAVSKRMPEGVQKAVEGVGNRVNAMRNGLYERVTSLGAMFRKVKPEDIPDSVVDEAIQAGKAAASEAEEELIRKV